MQEGDAGTPQLCPALFWLRLSLASQRGTQMPPTRGQFSVSSSEWRKAEINLEEKLLCLSGQTVSLAVLL